MADEPDNLVLLYLRRIDTKVDRLAGDMHDVKTSLTLVKEGPVGVQRRIDRLELHVDRMERRLDLVVALRAA